MNAPLRNLVVTAAAALLALIALIVWSIARDISLGAFMVQLASTPWGITTLVDLYTGLLLTFGLICFLDRRPLVCAVWLIALLGLGNFATLLFLIIRGIHSASISAFLTPSRR
jgi:hypothetical protein